MQSLRAGHDAFLWPGDDVGCDACGVRRGKRSACGRKLTVVLTGRVARRTVAGIELDEHPVLVNGKFHGFRITALRGDPGSWQGVDLRAGDVVTLVNGRSVERPQDAFDIFHGLEVAKELRVDFERDGGPRSFALPIIDDEPPSPTKH
jgi:S1-C subfamily serine protease